MASLRKTTGGSFVACFRFDGRHFQRGLKTKEPDAAEAAKCRIIDRMYKLSSGDLQIPAGIDVGDFIVWGRTPTNGTRNETATAENFTAPTLDAAIDLYLDEHRRLKADSTLNTERTHLCNFTKHLGAKAKLPMDRLNDQHLDAFLEHRELRVEPTTVLKERQTLKLLFAWAVRKKLLRESPARDLRRVQAGRDRNSFRTLEDIEAILERGGLSDEEVAALWECVYLTLAEIGEILSLVRERAKYDFIHPMFAVAAYTGMRRSEIVVRLRWQDVNFPGKSITARSRKQSRQQTETTREIALHPKLEQILRDYQVSRPKGQHVICDADAFSPLTVHQAHDHFQATLKGTRWEQKMPSGKQKVIIGFHTFRHSFASNLAVEAAGWDTRRLR